jgi:tryptophan synthase beta chain
VRLVAVEPAACPKLTRGVYALDVNDFSGTTPINRMYTLGSNYIAPPIFAGGLRYHGTSSFLSAMYADKGFDAMAVPQVDALGAGLLFAETEGILPAPESAHAVAGAINLAKQNPSDAPPRVLLVNISGHGLFDLNAYERCRTNTLDSDTPDEELLSASLRHVREFNVRIDESMKPASLGQER